MKHGDLRPWLSVIAGGESLISHTGGVVLTETARRTGVAGQLSRLFGPWRPRCATHDPGKIVADLAVAVAWGGDAAADIAVPRAQPGVFGLVASDPTVSRLFTRLAGDADGVIAAISTARAAARERVRQLVTTARRRVPAHRPHLALGRRDHHRPHPPLLVGGTAHDVGGSQLNTICGARKDHAMCSAVLPESL